MQSTVSKDTWVTECADWEKDVFVDQRVRTRHEFLAGCIRVSASVEFIADSKRRWDKGQFTAVTQEYLVIGDVFVRRFDHSLALKDEPDFSTESSHLGRENLTYDVWNNCNFMEEISAVRPKINGERFVLQRIGHERYLSGFLKYLVPKDFKVEVAEYYAGSFYVLWPLIVQPVSYQLFLNNEPMNVTFHPHPFITPQDYLNRLDLFQCNHKYDGIMLWSLDTEYRSKWEPTIEVEMNGIPWEVRYAADFLPIRPRPGKSVTPKQSAVSRIRSCMRAAFVIPFLHKQEKTVQLLPQEILDVQQMSEKRSFVSAKLFVITRDRRIVMIRLPDSRLDFIGGTLKDGESPVDGLSREYYAQTKLQLSTSDVFFFG